MDSTNLRDFRPDRDDFESEPDDSGSDLKTGEPIGDSGDYQQEINTLKIDKLSNKITIISILIPVMIGAIIAFAYIDMKERVVDVDQTKQSQVDQITKQLEEKLNALDVKIAKNRFDLENTLPELKEKTTALDGHLTKLNSTKADNKKIQAQISQLKSQATANAKNAAARFDKIDEQTASAIQNSRTEFDKTASQIREDINLFKEEFDARLLELSDYEEQIGLLRKDLSLLDKKFQRMEQDQLKKSQLTAETAQLKKDIRLQKELIDKQMIVLEDKLAAEIGSLKAKISRLTKPVQTPAPKPAPQVNIEPSQPGGVKQEPLAQ